MIRITRLTSLAVVVAASALATPTRLSAQTAVRPGDAGNLTAPATGQQPETPATPAPTTPAANVSPVQTARANATAARLDLAKARQALSEVTKKLQAEVDTKPELAAAVKTYNDAQTAYDQAVAKVKETLATNPDYQAATAAVDAAKKQVDGTGEGPSDARTTAASKALVAREQLTSIENKALDADPTVQSAKSARASALLDLNKLRQQFGNFNENPDYVAAKQAIETAKTSVADAEKAVADAEKQAAQQRQAAAQAAAARTQAQQHAQPRPRPTRSGAYHQ